MNKQITCKFQTNDIWWICDGNIFSDCDGGEDSLHAESNKVYENEENNLRMKN